MALMLSTELFIDVSIAISAIQRPTVALDYESLQ